MTCLDGCKARSYQILQVFAIKKGKQLLLIVNKQVIDFGSNLVVYKFILNGFKSKQIL